MFHILYKAVRQCTHIKADAATAVVADATTQDAPVDAPALAVMAIAAANIYIVIAAVMLMYLCAYTTVKVTLSRILCRQSNVLFPISPIVFARAAAATEKERCASAALHNADIVNIKRPPKNRRSLFCLVLFSILPASVVNFTDCTVTKRLLHIYDTLIFGATEAKHQTTLREDKLSVHQYITEL